MSDVKHFAVTTYILDPGTKSILLLWHTKLQAWLPPGGHMEANETPEEAAKREIEEETSITELEFIPKIKSDKTGKIDERASFLKLPHHLLLENINDDHYHMDWIFFAKINSSVKTSEELRWFDTEGLHRLTNLFENVKILAIEGIDKYC